MIAVTARHADDLTWAEVHAERAKSRRVRLAADRYCINGESHGKVAVGVRCDWCKAVHRYGLSVVIADPDAPRPPPGYVVRRRPS